MSLMPANPLTPEQLQDAVRLKALYMLKRTELGLTQEAVAAACGWESQGTVSQYLNGKIPLNLDAAAKFARVLRCQVSDFSASIAIAISKLRDVSHTEASENDNLLPSLNTHKSKRTADSLQEERSESMQAANIFPITAPGVVVIPQYSTGGAMGHGLVLHEQPGVIERWTVTGEWLKNNARGYSSAKNLCIVTGFGPSMRPMFNPGDPLLVDRGVREVSSDGVYFFRIENEGFVKQLQRIPRPGGGVIYRAKSANPDYDSFDIDAAHDFEVLGKVLRVWCGTDF